MKSQWATWGRRTCVFDVCEIHLSLSLSLKRPLQLRHAFHTLCAHMSAYVSIRQHTSVSIRQHTLQLRQDFQTPCAQVAELRLYSGSIQSLFRLYIRQPNSSLSLSLSHTHTLTHTPACKSLNQSPKTSHPPSTSSCFRMLIYQYTNKLIY